MNEAEFESLKEASWRRKLTAQEKADLEGYLATRFEEHVRWEEEAGLNKMLGQLPEAPVSTNFTARVLQSVEHAETTRQRDKPGVFRWLRFTWLPRIAIATMLISGGFISFQQYKRAQVASDVATVSTAATVPPQWLQDFEAIDQLSEPPVDHELLAALQ